MYILTHIPTQTHYGRSSSKFSKSRIYTFETFEHAKQVGDSLATFHTKFKRFPKTRKVYHLPVPENDALESELWIEKLDERMVSTINDRSLAMVLTKQDMSEEILHFCFGLQEFMDSLENDYKKSV